MRKIIVLLFAFVIASNAAQAEKKIPPYPRVPSGLLIERLDGGLPGAAVETVSPRPIVQIGLDLIKVFEGWSAKPYDDPAGYCTVGYGHLIAKKKCSETDVSDFASPLSEERGNELLAKDTTKARVAIQRLVEVDINDRQFAALTSFVFNVGEGNFRKSTMLRALNDGDVEVAKREFPKWIRANGVKLRGLEVRRNCEVSLFDGDTLARLNNGDIDTTACGDVADAAPTTSETIDIYSGEVFR